MLLLNMLLDKFRTFEGFVALRHRAPITRVRRDFLTIQGTHTVFLFCELSLSQERTHHSNNNNKKRRKKERNKKKDTRSKRNAH
jgi:hypothetical protein